MTGRRMKVAMWAAVGSVAGFAAVISYAHIYELGRAHGGSHLAARLLPLSVDGLIVAASLLVLHEAGQRRPAPFLAWLMLILGALATVAANVAYGAAWGWPGAVIWAWPALGFVGSVELLAILLRRTGQYAGRGLAGPVPAPVPASNEDAALHAYAASLAGGNPLSRNQLVTRYNLTRTQAAQVLAAANGHGPEGIS